MKKYFTIIIRNSLLQLFAIMCICSISFSADAQKINVTVNIIPPYSPYYSDYSGPNAAKVLLLLQNTTNQPQVIKLTGKLQGDNGVTISTRNNYVPLVPVTLSPNEVRQLNGTALKDIFDLNNLNVLGIDKAKLAQSSRLPEGNYSFCIQAVDINTNVVLSATAPLGCTQLSIVYPEAPILVNPAPASQVIATSPQTVIFNWINAGNVPIGTQYTIQMVPMPDASTDPNQVLNAASLPILSQTVSATSYIYSLANIGLTPGKRYAWRVIASDPTGKILFKNNGVSGASYFVYGDKPPILFDSVKTDLANLNIINPSCDGTPSIIIGDHLDMNIAWLWREQLISQQYFGTLDSTLLKHYTQMPTANGMVSLGKYKLEFHRVTNIKNTGPEYANLTFLTTAPQQVFTMTYTQAVAQRFVPGETYTVTVTALDAKGNQLEKVTSCEWKLLEADKKALPKLNIKGRLVYTFDKSAYYGANNTNITLQLSDSKAPGPIDMSKNYVSVTTDANGNFNVQLTQLPTDVGSKRLQMRINNPYYSQPDTNFLISKMPALNYSVVNNTMQIAQDTLSVGELKTFVYSNNLTVNIKKGFPKSLTNKEYEDVAGDQNGYTQDVFIDAATIDTMARVPDGLKVILYRKNKAADIPAFEGDIKSITSISAKKTVLTKFGMPSVIKVAEGQTIGGLQGKSKVVFNNLLCNFRTDDEYYIQLELPTDAVTKKDELTAPETMYRFKPLITAFKTSFTNTFNYNIISQKPPTAKVKGRVMYQWPSTPGVLHPYANQLIYVAEQYKVHDADGKPINDPCIVKSTSFNEKVTFGRNNSYTNQWKLSDQNDGMQVGQVKTDANGYFEVEILVPTKMGAIDGVKIDKPGVPCPEIKKKEINIITAQPLLDLSGAPYMTGDNYTNSMYPGNSFSFQDQGQNSNHSLNQMLGGAAGNLKITKAFGDVTSDKAKAGGVQLKAISNGPDAGDEELPLRDESYVDRYFHIQGIPRVASIDSAAEVSAAHFVVQPFKTIDLGTVITNVNEIADHPVNISTNGNDELLAGAKLVVFRSWMASGHSALPDGEGSLKHPVKPLISPTFKVAESNTPVEWVIDTALSLNGKTRNLGNMRLFNGPTTLYSVMLSPNPEGASGYFKTDPGAADIYGKSTGITVTPINSRIAGRVLNGKTGKPVAGVLVTLKVGASYKTLLSDDQGYFEVQNKQFSNFEWADGQYMSIQNVSKPGFIQSSKDTVQQIKAKGQSYYRTLSMVPNKYISFKSVDAITQANVPGYAMLEDSSIVENSNSLNLYQLYLSNNASQNIKIIPVDPAYFDETISISGNQISQAAVKLYKRHHRIRFRIFNPNFLVAATQFKILINNKPYEPVYKNNSADGTISFDFENVSVNNYTIQVLDVSDKGFIPMVFNLKNEESKDFITYDVRVEKGAEIRGTVTLNKKFVLNARVYLDYQTNQSVSNLANNGNKTASSLLEARTDKNGYFVIKGIPVTQSFTVKMHATLDTSFTVNGAVKDVNVISQQVSYVQFDLAGVSGFNVNNIYGFPLSVESIEKISSLKYKVTGLIDLTKKNQSPFVMLGGTDKVRVADVILTTKNLVTWEPVDASLNLDGIQSLKMKYLDQYNVKLESPNKNKLIVLPLNITKDGAGGVVNANVSITDNSFNYPSSYLNFTTGKSKTPIPFYLVDPSSRVKNIKPVIGAIYNTQKDKIKYHLSDASSDSLQFSFIGFENTKADPDNSYIDPVSKQIHLDITLNGKVPHSNQGYVKLHVKDLLLDGYSIKPVTGSEPLTVDLQTWKLKVPKWTIDPKLGGISSESSYIATGIIDIPAKTFNLRSDLFVLDSFQVDKISLGGGLVNITGIKKDGTFLVFDEACGSDHLAHWRFSAIGQNNQPVGTVPLPAVPGKIAAANIDINYFQLISYNNENIINLSPKQPNIPIYNNKKFTFLPSSITSGVGTYYITGNTTFDVPRVGSQAVSLIYTKANGKDDMTVGNFLPINFEGKGYVQFTSDKGATFNPVSYGSHITSITGKVVEPGKFNPIPCTLTFGEMITGGNSTTTDMGTITLKQGYKLRMDGNTDKEAGPTDVSLTIGDAATNKMSVDASKDWGTLNFSGPLNDPKSNNGAQPMQKEPTMLSFNVLGDLKVSSSQVKMDKISTPLGDLALVYDFPIYTLRGALHMNKVKFGSYDFTGDIQTTMGPDGMLMLGAGKLNTGTLFVEGFGVLNIGVLFGNTDLSPGNIQTVTQYSKAKNSLCWLQDNNKGFKGFFLTGGLDVIDKHEKFNFVVASGYFNANLGVEASIGANFNKGSYMALLGAHGDVNAGLSSITGTSITGGLKAHLTGEATYTADGFAINGDAGVTIKYEIKQYVPIIGTQHIGGQKGAKVNFGVGGGQKSYFNFSLADDGNAVTCAELKNVQ